MIYHLGIEEIEPGYWLAWVFDLFGCYCKGSTRQEVIENSPLSIRDFIDWAEGYESVPGSKAGDIEVHIKEEFLRPDGDDEYRINAFFDDDRKALGKEEVYQIKWLANCTRRDLEAIVQTLDKERLKRPIDGEVQTSINGILMHVATAERWYFDALGLAFDRAEVPTSPFAALSKVRTHSLLQLDQLADNTIMKGRRGEDWSARKICRRMLWHEQAHTRQIEKYLSHG